MRVRLFLAHAAEVQSDMLFAMGAGWTEIGPQPSPLAIAAIVEVPWDETNRQHTLEISIIDEDGQPFLVPTPAGDQPVRFEARFDVGRPPGVTAGRSFNVPVAINLQPLPFQAGRQYLVRASINGQPRDEVTFFVRQQVT